ncbi:hypothetical protein [Nocardia sp. NBC_00416]|uniref:hypothetical protein n=1 Tax=Nocardia sp. NBC_00416 TaxID=2975991 RepID=UPI002E1EAD69
MNWSKRVRQIHRVLAIVLTVTVVLTVVALVLRAPIWVSYLPLPPLALLFFSGLYLYVLPFVGRWRGGPAGAVPSGRAPGAGGRSTAHGIRTLHRGAAVVFTVTVLATFVASALPEPLVWVSYLPLFPLAALLLSGLYMFVLPYRGARRGDGEIGGDEDTRSLMRG